MSIPGKHYIICSDFYDVVSIKMRKTYKLRLHTFIIRKKCTD